MRSAAACTGQQRGIADAALFPAKEIGSNLRCSPRLVRCGIIRARRLAQPRWIAKPTFKLDSTNSLTFVLDWCGFDMGFAAWPAARRPGLSNHEILR